MLKERVKRGVERRREGEKEAAGAAGAEAMLAIRNGHSFAGLI